MATHDPDTPVPGPPAGRRGRALLFAAAGLLAVTALGLCLAYFLGRRPADGGGRAGPRDPRLDYAGPFRNVAPDVRYVPDDRCADCHADKALAFAEQPMARSLRPVARAESPPAGPE